MPTQIGLTPAVQQLLRCPICHSKLRQVENHFLCTNSECANHFPIINGIPVLLNEKTSVFSAEELISQNNSVPDGRNKSFLQSIRRFIPSISVNIKAKENYIKLNDLLLKQSPSPCILVIGGRIPGQGMEVIMANPSISLVESDVSFGPRTMLINDAHEIPFEDHSFDAVIIQAVLEYLVDPYKCVEEIERILKPQGIVYAETPFMQQVHGGPYDFMRFTHLGHRRLFRKFTEIDSGAVCGPGMSLAWSYQYFLLSFTSWGPLRTALKIFAILTSFYFKYFDYYLINKPGAFDAASGYYFIGRKDGQILSDRELIKLYKGAI